MSGYTSPIKLPNTERMHTHSFYIAITLNTRRYSGIYAGVEMRIRFVASSATVVLIFLIEVFDPLLGDENPDVLFDLSVMKMIQPTVLLSTCTAFFLNCKRNFFK